MKIFYHVDLDGRACGAILTRRYPQAECYLYNYWYEKERILKHIRPNEEVIFADIVPPSRIVEEILKLTTNITFLDHHSGAISDLATMTTPFEYKGIITNDGLGACILVWEYCYPNSPVPSAIRWIAEYDAFERTPDNKLFQFGIGTFNTFPKSKIWDRVLKEHDPTIRVIRRAGRNVLAYLVPWYKRLVNSYGMSGFIRPEIFEGACYSAYLLNQGAVDSSVFDDVNQKHDIYVRVTFGKSWRWLVSVTTERTDIDLKILSNKFGGSGHNKACGFTVESLDDFFMFPDEGIEVQV